MPTFTAGRLARVHLNGSDLTSYFKTASASASADTTEATAFGDVAKVYIATVKDATFSADGMLQSGTTTVDGVLSAAIGVDGTELTYYPAGDTLGQGGVAFQGVDVSHQVSSPVDGISAVSMSLQSAVGAESVVSQVAWAASTAAGTAASVDNGAATTAGAVGYLHAQVVGGTLTAKIQDSASGTAGWADVITFSAVPSGTASERVAVAGTFREFTQAVWTLTGGTATFQVSAGRTPKL